MIDFGLAQSKDSFLIEKIVASFMDITDSIHLQFKSKLINKKIKIKIEIKNNNIYN